MQEPRLRAPDDKTYKLELLAESNRSRLTESDLLQHGFKGGKSLEIPNCNNMELINYIKSVFDITTNSINNINNLL